MSEWLHQQLAVVGTIDPVVMSTSGATSSTTSAWTDAIDMDVFAEAMFILSVNTIAASSGVTLTIYSDSASATGGMTSAVATASTLVNADDDKQVVICVSTEDMNPDGRDRYLRGKLVVAPTTSSTATATVAAVVLGGKCRFAPASDYDLSSVDQIINS